MLDEDTYFLLNGKLIRRRNYNGKNNPNYGKHPIPWNKGKPFLKGEKNPRFGIQSNFMKNYWRNHFHPSINKPAWNKGLTKEDDPRIAKYAKKIKMKFKDVIFKEKKIREMLKNVTKKPNELEQKLIKIIQENNFPFKYVGNWEFVLGGKCPDFLNVNGQKLLIELFGNYWHTVKARETPEERTNYFKQYGFNTLIIFQNELQNKNKIINKIKNFMGDDIAINRR